MKYLVLFLLALGACGNETPQTPDPSSAAPLTPPPTALVSATYSLSLPLIKDTCLATVGFSCNATLPDAWQVKPGSVTAGGSTLTLSPRQDIYWCNNTDYKIPATAGSSCSDAVDVGICVQQIDAITLMAVVAKTFTVACANVPAQTCTCTWGDYIHPQ